MSLTPNTLTLAELDRRYAALPPRPARVGTVLALTVRPGPDLREARDEIVFDPVRGAVGDRWERKTWLYLPDGSPDPRVQVAVCNTAVLALMREAAGVNHHPGDTLFTDLDLSEKNLPAGSRLQVGEAVIEVSDVENDACAKFAAQYGEAVFRWIRRPENRALRLRGLFARVIVGGRVRCGDAVRVEDGGKR
jgi:hypothetical protein